MVESWRPEHALDASDLTVDEDGIIIGERGKRICPWCELDLRWEEWPEFSAKEREANPNYCLWEQVLMDMNKNTGYVWKAMGTNIKRAKIELQQEMSSSSTWSWPQTQK
eukprot:12926870-Prorocentrum_lima.AAC.1